MRARGERDAWASLDATAVAAAVRARRLSAVEAFEAARGAILAGDGEINAVVVRDFERAEASARAADARIAAGDEAPLLGVPVTVKESFFVPGLPTTWGVEAFRGWTPEFEATAVSRLRRAGAVVLGKTNVPTWLASFDCANTLYGRTRNPLDPSRTPGGSSGGSAAALAAGYTPLELGSDLAGSIRVPACFCGVYGHNPTKGLVPMTGQAPPATPSGGPELELGVVGPMARSVRDLALALGVLAGPEEPAGRALRFEAPRPRSAGGERLRICVLHRHPAAEASSAVLSGLERAARVLEGSGARRLDLDLTARLELERMHALFLDLLEAILGRMAPEAPVVPAARIQRLLVARGGFARRFQALFEEVDVVLAPAVSASAPPVAAVEGAGLGGGDAGGDPRAWSGLATLPGLPATAAPVGRDAAGLPVGLQILGPAWEDWTPLAAAEILERSEVAGESLPS